MSQQQLQLDQMPKYQQKISINNFINPTFFDKIANVKIII